MSKIKVTFKDKRKPIKYPCSDGWTDRQDLEATVFSMYFNDIDFENEVAQVFKNNKLIYMEGDIV